MCKSTYYRFSKNVRNRFRCSEMKFSGRFKSGKKYFDRKRFECSGDKYALKKRLNTREKSNRIRLLHRLTTTAAFVDRMGVVHRNETRPSSLTLLATSRQSKQRRDLLLPFPPPTPVGSDENTASL